MHELVSMFVISGSRCIHLREDALLESKTRIS